MKNLENKYRVVLAKALMSIFNTGDWGELFTITACEDFPENYRNFYQDVHWGNSSLKMGCISAVNHILDADPKNIIHIWEMDKVQNHLEQEYPETFNSIKDIINNNDARLVAKPVPTNINENIHQALEDAETLIHHRSSANAYDRIHTALHSFLRQACDNNNIAYNKTDSISALLPKISTYIKSLPDDGRNDKVFNMLRSANSMLDSINYLRNHHSLSHPTEELLNEYDARFAINLVRSITTYVDDLLS
jgi:hypothetical protein